MKIYLVGGAVRDKLLGLPVNERDWVVVGATPEEMLTLSYQQVGGNFPVFLHPDTKEEYALARTERKTGPGYKGFSFDFSAITTLEEDLARRDLTVNAMAEDSDGKLVDPFHGQRDLNDKILRHVSDAFSEDPVRILRAARFLARFKNLGFRIADETWQLMADMVEAGETRNLVPERVWQELQKALETANPECFQQTLARCGALADVLPELDSPAGEQCLTALLQASRLSDDPIVRCAAWLAPLETGQIESLCERLRVPKEYSALALLVHNNQGFFEDATQLPPPQILAGLERVDAFRRPERFEQFLLAAEAVSRAKPGRAGWPHPQREYLHTALNQARAITAKDLTKVRLEGKALAEELSLHRRAAISKIKRTYRWAKFD
ncbi:MAG TPA: multifunctional CCA tRNA nucleotidyl transferase/2'3'-cyclic phosphodiesterase/2'nucleotidase/phosphatase [Gammaproteobacteria bacterium]